MRARGGLSVQPHPRSVNLPPAQCSLCFKHPWVKVGEKPYCMEHGTLIHKYAIVDALERWWERG